MKANRRLIKELVAFFCYFLGFTLLVSCTTETTVPEVAVHSEEEEVVDVQTAGTSYQNDIQPIFDQYCINCHGNSAGLSVHTYNDLMKGSDSGAVVVPSDPDSSELYLQMDFTSPPGMPLGKDPLPAELVELIRLWIQEGAENN